MWVCFFFDGELCIASIQSFIGVSCFFLSWMMYSLSVNIRWSVGVSDVKEELFGMRTSDHLLL